VEFDILIRGSLVASGAGSERADVGVKDGRIERIGDLSALSGIVEIDASELAVLPGAIDTQVHFREPGAEHKEDLESGSLAGVMGGVTAIFDMPNTKPPTTTAESLADKLRRAEGRSWCHYAFYVGASPENAGSLADLEMLPGTPGVKVFMGSSTGSLLVEDDETLLKVLEHGTRRVAVHSEDERRLRERKSLLTSVSTAAHHPMWRDPEVARLATERLLKLSAEAKRPVHILHVSTSDELPLIERAKRAGLGTTAEVTPQHLWFYAPDCYERLGTLAQMNPPIRDSWHQMALRQAVVDGLFDMVGSDHAPHTVDEKLRPYPESPSGMPGVQTLLPVMLDLAFTGLLTLEQVVRLTSEGPAEVFGLTGKGRVKEGFDADLCVVDLKEPRIWTRELVASKCGWTPWDGECLTGVPRHVVVGGRMCVMDGRLVGRPSGRMLQFEWKPDATPR